MSKFVDRLQSLSKSSATPIGFHPSVSEPTSLSMLLIAGLSGTQIKEAKDIADANADAGLILSEGSSGRIVKQLVEAAGDVPIGVFVAGMSEKEMDELPAMGCDFVVFDIQAATAVLHKEGVGRFLMIEPSLDQGLARAINSLEVDGVFISSRGGESFVGVRDLLVCQRFVELLEEPVIMALPSVATKADLASLWQAGADGVVAPSTQSVETLGELKKMISGLPRGVRGRRAKAGAMLPHYGVAVAEEAEEEEERI
jgi:hypothetical protein